MSLTLVDLKEKLKDQVKELLKVDDFKITYARVDENNKSWNITITYVTESQPDPNGRKFRIEGRATLTADPEGKIINISAF